MKKRNGMKQVLKSNYDNGNVQYETWLLGVEFHRIGGPALIEYFKGGNIKREEWYVNGKTHRLDGPADIWYYLDGRIRDEHWFVKDKNITNEMIEWIEENGISAPYSEADEMAIKLRWY
jgi:antitoxin component YwqK of YwqJK toxin-antitoxin module